MGAAGMAFAYDVWHVNGYGRSYQGAEQWSMGFWLGKPAAHAGIPSQANANSIHNRMKTFFGLFGSRISWAFTLDGVKIQKWNADGTQDKSQTQFSQGIAAQAGGAQNNIPPQLALAIGFRGNIARGPGANGRMYLPGFVNIPTVSGHVEQNDINSVSTGAAAMFTGINQDLAATGEKLILASKGGTNPVRPPVNVLVTNLRVGDVVDTIQRRRNGLRENFTLTPVAP
jgi:hypothetical protein